MDVLGLSGVCERRVRAACTSDVYIAQVEDLQVRAGRRSRPAAVRASGMDYVSDVDVLDLSGVYERRVRAGAAASLFYETVGFDLTQIASLLR
ncbi:MAG: hypothetical protein WBA17_11580 [Saprospiraceae bacterium]